MGVGGPRPELRCRRQPEQLAWPAAAGALLPHLHQPPVSNSPITCTTRGRVQPIRSSNRSSDALAQPMASSSWASIRAGRLACSNASVLALCPGPQSTPTTDSRFGGHLAGRLEQPSWRLPRPAWRASNSNSSAQWRIGRRIAGVAARSPHRRSAGPVRCWSRRRRRRAAGAIRPPVSRTRSPAIGRRPATARPATPRKPPNPRWRNVFDDDDLRTRLEVRCGPRARRPTRRSARSARRSTGSPAGRSIGHHRAAASTRVSEADRTAASRPALAHARRVTRSGSGSERSRNINARTNDVLPLPGSPATRQFNPDRQGALRSCQQLDCHDRRTVLVRRRCPGAVVH